MAEFSILPKNVTSAPIIKIGRRNSRGAWVDSIGQSRRLFPISEPKSRTLRKFIEENDELNGQGSGGVIAVSINETGIEAVFDRFGMRARLERPVSEKDAYEVWISVLHGVVLYRVTLGNNYSEIEKYNRLGEELSKKTVMSFNMEDDNSIVVDQY